MADENIDGLIVKIKADLSDYIEKLDQMQQKTGSAAGRAAKSIDGVGKSLAVVGTAFATFSATAIKSAMNWGNAVDDLSDKTGLAGEKSSELLLIAKRVGIGADEAGGMFTKLARSAHNAAQAQADAAAQGKTSTDVYTRLGVTLTKSDGTIKDTAELFGEVKKAIMDLPDGLQKTAIEMELFGRSGAEMHDMLNMTDSEMQAVIDKGRSLGLILSTEQAAAWETFSRDVNGAKGTLTAIGITIGNEAMPKLRELLDTVNTATKAFAHMDPENRKVMLGIGELAFEVGIASMAISKITGVVGGAAVSLGVMRAATLAAAGPWGALATAIGIAFKALVDFKKEQMDDVDHVEYDSDTGKVIIIKKSKVRMGDSPDKKRATDAELAALRNTSGDGLGYVGNLGGSAKTELEQYLANLTEYKDIWQRQIDLGQITQTQFRELLAAQLAGLEAISVGEDEQLSKERGIYDLKSLLRQADLAMIAEQRAKTDADYAKQSITEQQHFEQRKAQITAEMALQAEGSAARYAKLKELADLETQHADKQRQRYLTNIGYQQQLANAEIAIEQEQIRHQQRMQAIGAIGTTENQLERNAADEKRILDRQYQNNLNAINKTIEAYRQGGEQKADALKDELAKKAALEAKYNADSLKADNKLAEQKAELVRQTASEYSQMIADMITGTGTGQDIMQKMWADFVQKVIEKLLTINKVTNIVDSIVNSIFSGGGGSPIKMASGFGDLLPGFAGGGDVQAGVPIKVGEFGEEIFVPTTSGKILPHGSPGADGVGAAPQEISVNVINNTGVEATPTVSTSYDIDKKIITVMLDAVQRDVMGTRSLIKGVARK